MTWVLITVILVALTAVACLSFRGKGGSIESVSSFTPNPMNDKIVLVKGWNETQIQKIINDFVEMYKNDGPSNLINKKRICSDLLSPKIFTQRSSPS
jgi:hypothetical protein